MTFRSIHNLILVSLLVAQTVHAQIQVPASGSSALQEQGSQDKKIDRSSVNGDGSSTEKASIPDPLLSLPVSKGLLTTEATRVVPSADPANQSDRLSHLLKHQ